MQTSKYKNRTDIPQVVLDAYRVGTYTRHFLYEGRGTELQNTNKLRELGCSFYRPSPVIEAACAALSSSYGRLVFGGRAPLPWESCAIADAIHHLIMANHTHTNPLSEEETAPLHTHL